MIEAAISRAREALTDALLAYDAADPDLNEDGDEDARQEELDIAAAALVSVLCETLDMLTFLRGAGASVAAAPRHDEAVLTAVANFELLTQAAVATMQMLAERIEAKS